MPLTAAPRSQRAPLVLQAEGNSVSKAVTVAEITKRRLPGLHQNTQIGLRPVDGESQSATDRTPTIAILLSTAPLDATQPGCAQDPAAVAKCVG